MLRAIAALIDAKRANKAAAKRDRRKSKRQQKPLWLESLEARLTPAAPMVVASALDNALYQFDSGSGALEKTLVAPGQNSPLSGPAGLAVGPDSNLYISSQGNNTIFEYNFSTAALTTFIDPITLNNIAVAANGSGAQFQPSGLQFGPDGNLYAILNAGQGAAGGGEVIRLNINSSPTGLHYAGTYTTVATNLIRPSALTFGVASGDTTTLYVTDSGHDNVIQVTNATTSAHNQVLTPFINGSAVGLNFPAGITWGPDGDLYVVDLAATSFEGNVYRFNPDGTNKTRVTPGDGSSGSLLGQFPSGIAFTGPASLVTANLGGSQTMLSGSVNQYNTDGTFIKTLVASGTSEFADGGIGASAIVVLPVHVPVVATSYFDSAIYEVDSVTGAIDKTLIAPNSSSVLFGPAGVTVGPDNCLYVTSQISPASELGDSIIQVNPNTGAQKVFVTYDQLQEIARGQNGANAQFAPAGVLFGPDGNLYVVENAGQGSAQGTGAVIRLGIAYTNGVPSYSGTSAVVVGNLTQPSNIVFGPTPGSTTLYVTDSKDQTVLEVDNATSTTPAAAKTLIAASAGIDYPSGLKWGPDGDLYVTDLGADTGLGNVYQYDPNVSPATLKPLTANSGTALVYQFPSDLLFDPAGNVLTANLGFSRDPSSLAGSIGQFAVNGTAQTLVSSSEFPNGIGTAALTLAPVEINSVTVNGDTAPIISAAQITGGDAQTVTVTTDGPSGFSIGQTVSIAGVNNGSYNGLFVITGVSGNTFTYEASVSGLSAAAGGTATTSALGAGLLAGAQRSMVDSVVYTFNQPVTLNAGAVSLLVHSGGNAGGAAPSFTYSSPDGGTTWIVTFSGNGVVGNSIANGAYDIALTGSAVSALNSGSTLAGVRTDTFYRLFGDTVGHERVSAPDRNTFNGAFGTLSTSPNFLTYLDSDDNGRVSAPDRNAFNGDFGTVFSGFAATI